MARKFSGGHEIPDAVPGVYSVHPTVRGDGPFQNSLPDPEKLAEIAANFHATIAEKQPQYAERALQKQVVAPATEEYGVIDEALSASKQFKAWLEAKKNTFSTAESSEHLQKLWREIPARITQLRGEYFMKLNGGEAAATLAEEIRKKLEKHMNGEAMERKSNPPKAQARPLAKRKTRAKPERKEIVPAPRKRTAVNGSYMQPPDVHDDAAWEALLKIKPKT